MSDAANNAGTKKKSKKRRKGKNGGKGSGGPPKLPEEDVTDMPKQVSEEDQVITTAKCQRCKGLFRQTVVQNGLSMSVIKSANWLCPSCLQEVKVEEEKGGGGGKSHAPSSGVSVGGETNSGGCNCSACVTKRANAVSPEAENDAQVTQRHWMEIRQMVRTIYRENKSLANQSHKALIGSKEMVSIVSVLSSRDPHLFFQRLETLAREYLLEVKVRLLEQLSCGFNSPQLAIEFIQMLLEEYAILCNALPSLLFLLKPVEACDSVKKLGMTIELMNKNIFRELIFAESFMSSNLPLIIAQLRLASFSADQYHRSTAEELGHRYTMLDEEMNEICKIWKSAIEHLNNQHREDQKNHFERIRADGESFKQQVKMQNSEDKLKSSGDGKSASECSREKSSSRSTGKSSSKPLCEKHMQNSSSSDTTPTHTLIKSHIGHRLGSKEASEWSELLFKCISPIGEPDYQLKASTAIETVTIHVDMTKLNLSHARPCCHRDKMLQYLDMGLTTEEVVELTLKLSALEALGIHLKIEDLFDDEGFSLTDLNRLMVEQPTSLPKPDVDYLVHSDDEEGHTRPSTDNGKNCGCLYHSPEDEVNFIYLKEKILLRQKYNIKSGSMSSGYVNGDKKRQQDFLQGMVMKIRFIRRLTGGDQEKRPHSTQYDKVQVKLTQLELCNVRMVASSKSIGHVLGPERDLPSINPPMHPLSTNGKQKSDYVFVHTDFHQEFMDLLLDKRRDLDVVITNKEKARREAKKPQPATDTAKKTEKTKTTTTAAADKQNKENLTSASLPHYQVQEEQEAVQASSSRMASEAGGVGGKEKAKGDGEEVKKAFKPVYQSLRTQPCQCSACIGAVATLISPNYCIRSADPSPETITIECSLTSHGEGGRQRKGPLHSREKLVGKANVNVTMDMTCTTDLDSHSPLSNEVQWQNWMSTSGRAQLESESHITNGNHQYSNHHHCVHGDRELSSELCEEHEAEYGSSSSAAHQVRSCSNHHAGSSCLKEGDSCKNSQTNNSSSSNSGDMPRRYCLCSYCELFGNNGPPTAPTSQNYTKRRDIMRQKLEEKKKRKDQKSTGSSSRSRGKQKANEQTSLEELLAFIEGDGEDGEQSNTSKTSKKQKKKKKLPVNDYHLQNSGRTSPSGQYVFHPMNQASSNGSHSGTKAHHSKDGLTQEDRMQDSHDVNGDEYDDELEEFKKFCFDDAPVGPRKKIAVNMNDIMSKIQ